MISASHNPMPDNDRCLPPAGTMPDALEDEIEARLAEQTARPTGAEIGRSGCPMPFSAT